MNSTVIGIAIVLLVLFGSQIFSGVKSAWLYVSTRMPSFSGVFSTTIELPAWKALLLIFAFWLISGGASWQGCTLPALPGLPSLVQHATAATYVYEKDDTGTVPTGVLTAFDKLNRKGIVATNFEHDSKNGNQQIPDQYKVAVAAATELPSLVATKGEKVLKVTKDPKTEAQVLEGVP